MAYFGLNFLFFVVLMCCFSWSHSEMEMFSSLAHLEQVLHTEQALANDLNVYVTNEQARLDKLRSIADEFQQHSKDALSNKDKYLGNPVNAYFLLKRFTLDWADIQAKYIDNDYQVSVLHNKLESHKAMLPGTDDLGGAISALLRLQDTYRISAEKLANGDFLGNNSELIKSPELSVNDCFLFGRDSYTKEDYYHAILWFEEALHRVESESLSANPSKATIIDYLSFAVFKQGDIVRAHELTTELLRLDPNHERANGNLVYFKSVLAKHSGGPPSHMTLDEFRYHGADYKKSGEYELYERLCRGEETIKRKGQLSCRLVTNNHPFLILQPAKEETVSKKPWIALYHNIIPDEYINKIKEIASPRLGRATVQNPITGNLEFAEYRVSKSAWLKSFDDPVVEKVSKIIEAVTNLTMSTAEDLQVANYGIGGQYEPHFDFARPFEGDSFKSLGTGNRIATWLLYMSDVHAGGATVFPHIGVKVFPEKGAAAFWHNLFPSGRGDELTRHAACPVLAGTKWVSNKWIHEKGQEFRRPCVLDPNL